VRLSGLQAFVIMAMVSISSIVTRFLPFLLENQLQKGGGKQTIAFLSRVLPYSAIGMLVVYCFKDVVWSAFPFGMPEVISAFAVGAVFLKWRNTLWAIGSGTVLYMILVQAVFV
jgi:branched-subunit amino acid transport protein AzlD